MQWLLENGERVGGLRTDLLQAWGPVEFLSFKVLPFSVFLRRLKAISSCPVTTDGHDYNVW